METVAQLIFSRSRGEFVAGMIPSRSDEVYCVAATSPGRSGSESVAHSDPKRRRVYGYDA